MRPRLYPGLSMTIYPLGTSNRTIGRPRLRCRLRRQKRTERIYRAPRSFNLLKRNVDQLPAVPETREVRVVVTLLVYQREHAELVQSATEEQVAPGDQCKPVAVDVKLIDIDIYNPLLGFTEPQDAEDKQIPVELCAEFVSRVRLKRYGQHG